MFDAPHDAPDRAQLRDRHYTVCTGEWEVGRIYETAAVPTVEDFAGPVTHHAILPLPRFLYPRCGVPSRGEFPGNGNQRSLAGTSNPI